MFSIGLIFSLLALLNEKERLTSNKLQAYFDIVFEPDLPTNPKLNIDHHEHIADNNLNMLSQDLQAAFPG